MSEGPDPERLKALEDRLKKAQAPYQPKPERPAMQKSYGAADLAWRMVIELVVGIAIGFGIGYGLDSLFGTIPIFLVLFTLLGFAAGVRTMLRSAKEIQERREAAEKAAKEQ